MATPTLVGTGVSSRPTGNGATSVYTLSHTLAAAADAVLFFVDNGNTNRTATAKYNGVAMTQAVTITSGSYRAYGFYMLAASLPAAGTYNFEVTFSGTITNGAVFNLAGCAVDGADQAAPEATSSLDISATDPVTTGTITTVADATLIVQAVLMSDARTIASWDSGQTAHVGAAGRYIASRTGPTPGGAQALNFNLSASSAKGATLAISLAGPAGTVLTPSGSEYLMASGTPTYSGVFDAFRGLVLVWP